MKLLIDERERAKSMVDFGPRHEKLLGRILLEGMDSLTDAEQIEFYLHCCKPKKGLDVQALAQSLAEKYGDLADTAFLSVQELMQAKGMYRSLAERFAKFGLLLHKFAEYEMVYPKIHIRSIIELCRHVLPLYRASAIPGTWQLCLNDDFELIYQREIAPSRAWGEEGFIQNALEDVEFTDARYAVIVQMCGRELSNPKPYDKEHAKLYAQRLSEMGCRLLDVVLVDEGRLTSMYELGMMGFAFGKKYDRQNYSGGEHGRNG